MPVLPIRVRNNATTALSGSRSVVAGRWHFRVATVEVHVFGKDERIPAEDFGTVGSSGSAAYEVSIFLPEGGPALPGRAQAGAESAAPPV